jgi:glutathione reductase (NADPH)
MMPAELGFPGAEYIITSDQFLELDRLPERIVFIGGGFISFEFAHVAVQAGSKVTIVHRGSRVLAGFDPDLVELLLKAAREIGVAILLETAAEGVERTTMGLRLRTSGVAVDADLIVHGAGRVPEIGDLNLGAAGVEFDKRGVRVNEFLQSVSNPSIYAAGDAAGSGTPALTPIAAYEGQVAAANLLKGNHRKSEPGAVPSVVFTVPPLASVGLHEHVAKAQGIRFRKNYQVTAGWYASRRIGENHSGFKVLIDEDNDRVLGAHLLGHNADELINIFTIAIQAGIPSRDLKQMIFAYPTHGSNISYML